MIHPEDAGKVRVPDLQGEFYAAMIATPNQTEGVLVKTRDRDSLVGILRDRVLKCYEQVVLFPPHHIRVVSPSPLFVKNLRDEAGSRVEDLLRGLVIEKVRQYQMYTGSNPPGFTKASHNAVGLNILMGEKGNLRWTGSDSLVASFRDRLDPVLVAKTCDPPNNELGFSSAPLAADDGVPSHMLLGSAWERQGQGYGKQRVGSVEINEKLLIHTTPWFYFDIVSPCPDVIDPILEEWKKIQSGMRDTFQKSVKEAKVQADQDRQLRLEQIRSFFRPF